MRGRPVRGRIPAQSYERSYSALRLCTTLLREPRSDESRQTAEREKVGAETIEQSPGDGALRRAEGDGPAWAAHPCPDHRPRSPAASGVPVRGCAGAAGGGQSWRGDHRTIAGRRRTPPSRGRRSGVGCASLPGSSPALTCGVRRPGPGLRRSRRRRARTQTGGSREPASSLQTMLSIHARKPHRHFVHFRSWRCPLPPDSPTGTLSTLVAEAVL